MNIESLEGLHAGSLNSILSSLKRDSNSKEINEIFRACVSIFYATILILYEATKNSRVVTHYFQKNIYNVCSCYLHTPSIFKDYR